MQTKFRRHQKVELLVKPNDEYVEPAEGHEDVNIKKGMPGKINIVLPNGQYHVEILNKKGERVAYAVMSEDDLKDAS